MKLVAGRELLLFGMAKSIAVDCEYTPDIWVGLRRIFSVADDRSDIQLSSLIEPETCLHVKTNVEF